jgi:F-type H+-transporting ATPase subunit delta
VADQSGHSIATVTSARALPAAQLAQLQTVLSAKYGKRLKINEIVDAAVIGGVRVQVGDDVIDGSISRRINDLRLQLVG